MEAAVKTSVVCIAKSKAGPSGKRLHRVDRVWIRHFTPLQQKHLGDVGICQICEAVQVSNEDFYKADGHCSLGHESQSVPSDVFPIPPAKLNVALQPLKKNNAGSEDGIVAEMLQTRHAGLVEAIALFFTNTLHRKLEPLQNGRWHD